MQQERVLSHKQLHQIMDDTLKNIPEKQRRQLVNILNLDSCSELLKEKVPSIYTKLKLFCIKILSYMNEKFENDTLASIIRWLRNHIEKNYRTECKLRDLDFNQTVTTVGGRVLNISQDTCNIKRITRVLDELHINYEIEDKQNKIDTYKVPPEIKKRKRNRYANRQNKQAKNKEKMKKEKEENDFLDQKIIENKSTFEETERGNLVRRPKKKYNVVYKLISNEGAYTYVRNNVKLLVFKSGDEKEQMKYSIFRGRNELQIKDITQIEMADDAKFNELIVKMCSKITLNSTNTQQLVDYVKTIYNRNLLEKQFIISTFNIEADELLGKEVQIISIDKENKMEARICEKKVLSVKQNYFAQLDEESLSSQEARSFQFIKRSIKKAGIDIEKPFVTSVLISSLTSEIIHQDSYLIYENKVIGKYSGLDNNDKTIFSLFTNIIERKETFLHKTDTTDTKLSRFRSVLTERNEKGEAIGRTNYILDASGNKVVMYKGLEIFKILKLKKEELQIKWLIGAERGQKHVFKYNRLKGAEERKLEQKMITDLYSGKDAGRKASVRMACINSLIGTFNAEYRFLRPFVSSNLLRKPKSIELRTTVIVLALETSNRFITILADVIKVEHGKLHKIYSPETDNKQRLESSKFIANLAQTDDSDAFNGMKRLTIRLRIRMAPFYGVVMHNDKLIGMIYRTDSRTIDVVLATNVGPTMQAPEENNSSEDDRKSENSSTEESSDDDNSSDAEETRNAFAALSNNKLFL